MTYFCAPISSIDHRLRGNVTPVSPALMSSVDGCCQQKSRIRTLAPLHKKLGNRRGTARCVVSVEMKSCQLPRNSTETTCTTSPEQIEVMKLEGYTGPMCNKRALNHDAIESLPLHYRCHKQTDYGRVVDITSIPTTCCSEIF